MAVRQQDRPALVTGAAGFVGANLVRALLADGAAVVATVRPGRPSERLAGIADESGLTVVPIDLLRRDQVCDLVEKIRPRWVFHLATSRAGDIAAMFETNVVVAAALLDAAARMGVQRFVNAGSSFEYGAAAPPFKESSCPRPTTAFGVSKAAASQLVEQQAASGKVPGVTLRLFHVYGPWEAPTRLVPTAIEAVLAGGELKLTPPGLRHDFIFVDDVVNALLRAARSEAITPGESLDICTGQQWANEAVVDTLEDLTGRRVVRRVGSFPPRSWDREDWTGDPTRAMQVLEWRPRGLHEGLDRTVAWTAARR